MLIHDWVNQQLYKTVGTIKYIVAVFYYTSHWSIWRKMRVREEWHDSG